MANNQSVRRHLDAFTRGRIIGKLEEGRSVTSVAAEFGIAHSIVSRLSRQFQTTGTLSWGSVVVVHKESHPQITGTLSYRPEETGGRQREKSLDTRHRRLDDRYRVLPWPEDCTVVVCLHDALYGVPLTPAHLRRRSLWCREHRNWRDNEWGRVLFTDESRFSLSNDSHRILIWRKRGNRNHPSNIIERDRYGGRCVLVWGGIMLGSRTDLHTFDAGSVNGTRYCNEILLPYVRLFRGAMSLQFLFMDDNAPCHRTVAAEQLLESEDIERQMPSCHSVHDIKLAVQDLWAHLPQDNIRCLINSIPDRLVACIAAGGVVQRSIEDVQYLCPCKPCIRLIVLFFRSRESLICVIGAAWPKLALAPLNLTIIIITLSVSLCVLNFISFRCFLGSLFSMFLSVIIKMTNELKKKNQ
ncbi:transposable element Tc3 transposase [Trichonephila clavipes]|uniref:Transposable element Tc3 transposase n=1 Tax=Trichonephila clavipes TaxID=2585209 RepID=A0A8X6SJ43_TRICX|nr:transposable element Tc3 transposase [Trichonephila clavipes]